MKFNSGFAYCSKRGDWHVSVLVWPVFGTFAPCSPSNKEENTQGLVSASNSAQQKRKKCLSWRISLTTEDL